MYKHFENMKVLYGDDVHIQVPNDIFRRLSNNIKNKNGSTNIQQSSFAYAYIVMVAFLYKYAHFVDVDNGTYIQNADIKEILGYSRKTKTIDHIIKKDGVIDSLGLTETTREYPIRCFKHPHEKINNIPLREYVYINEINENDVQYDMIRKIVKNYNYEVKEPLFLFEYNDDNGTLYEYSNTHKVTIDELLKFISEDKLDNIDMYMYFYFKSKCKGLKNNTKAIRLNLIVSEIGTSKVAFYSHLDILKNNKFIDVIHVGWTNGADDSLEANEYSFKGI